MKFILICSLFVIFAFVAGYNTHPYEQCKRKDNVNTMEDVMVCIDILETQQ